MKKIVLVLVLVAAAAWAGKSIAGKEDPTDVDHPVEANKPAALIRKVSNPATRPATASDIALAEARLRLLADSANKKLYKIRNLSRAEVRGLRVDANATQIQRARQLGMPQPFDLQREIASGKLVEIPDSTEYWTLHNLKFSVPYVTPSTQKLLIEIGRRFQHDLDSLGIPRFRLVITSALRTPETQAALRRVNRNASRIESAHQFGTTVDIAYRRFAAPVDAKPALESDTLTTLVDSILVKTAFNRGTELQAILGRIIADMRREGKLLVMMERSQPVYHMTLAKEYPASVSSR